MGKCTLTFDQIEILNKKSDSDHSDNDWLFITWFVKNQVVRTDKIPLHNQNGSRILDSGDHLLPVSSEVACEDADAVTAAFIVMNFGSYDWNEQIDAAGKVANKFAQVAAEVYLQAAKIVLENLGHFGANPILAGFALLLAQHWDELSKAVKDLIGTFLEDVLVPVLGEVVEAISVIFGRPNCNGPVFFDFAVFKNPTWPEPPLTLWKVYTAGSKSGCGSPAKTSVQYSLDRYIDFVPQFPTAPPPQFGLVPSANESPSNWLGAWAEDTLVQDPLTFVSIAPSTTASGVFVVSVSEEIDRRFNLVFETKADAISVSSALLLPRYRDNVPGTVHPWSSHAASPGALKVFTKLPGGGSGFRDASSSPSCVEDPRPVERYLALTWKRPFTAGTPLTFAKSAIVEAFVPGGSETSLLFEIADGFRIKDRDITLAFYNVLENGGLIGRALRYIRGATPAYTRADWMLVKLSQL
jgi:hypothetical protein